MNVFNNDLLGIKYLVFFQNPLPTSMWKRKRVKELYTYLSNVRFPRPYVAWCSTNHSCGDWLTDRWKVQKTIVHYGKAGNKSPMHLEYSEHFSSGSGDWQAQFGSMHSPYKMGLAMFLKLNFCLGEWCTRYFLQLSWRCISTINPLWYVFLCGTMINYLVNWLIYLCCVGLCRQFFNSHFSSLLQQWSLIRSQTLLVRSSVNDVSIY